MPVRPQVTAPTEAPLATVRGSPRDETLNDLTRRAPANNLRIWTFVGEGANVELLIRRAVVTTIAAGAVSVALAGAAPPALAEGLAGSPLTCTSSFDVMTLPEIRMQAERNGIPAAAALAMFAKVDGNEDGWICQKRMPSPLPNHYNFVDNQAVGLGRA